MPLFSFVDHVFLAVFRVPRLFYLEKKAVKGQQQKGVQRGEERRRQKENIFLHPITTAAGKSFHWLSQRLGIIGPDDRQFRLRKKRKEKAFCFCFGRKKKGREDSARLEITRQFNHGCVREGEEEWRREKEGGKRREYVRGEDRERRRQSKADRQEDRDSMKDESLGAGRQLRWK